MMYFQINKLNIKMILLTGLLSIFSLRVKTAENLFF